MQEITNSIHFQSLLSSIIQQQLSHTRDVKIIYHIGSSFAASTRALLSSLLCALFSRVVLPFSHVLSPCKIHGVSAPRCDLTRTTSTRGIEDKVLWPYLLENVNKSFYYCKIITKLSSKVFITMATASK